MTRLTNAFSKAVLNVHNSRTSNNTVRLEAYSVYALAVLGLALPALMVACGISFSHDRAQVPDSIAEALGNLLFYLYILQFPVGFCIACCFRKSKHLVFIILLLGSQVFTSGFVMLGRHYNY